MAILSFAQLLGHPPSQDVKEGSEPTSQPEQATDVVSRLLEMLEADSAGLPETTPTNVVPVDPVTPASGDDGAELLPMGSEGISTVTAVTTFDEDISDPPIALAAVNPDGEVAPGSDLENDQTEIEDHLVTALDEARSEADAGRASEQELRRVAEEVAERLAHTERKLAAAVEATRTEAARRQAAETGLTRLAEAGARHVAERELARLRNESTEHLSRIEQELAVAVETGRTTAARLAATEAEFCRFRAESSRRLAELEERVGGLVAQSLSSTVKPPRQATQGRRKATSAAPSATRTAKATKKKVATEKRKTTTAKKSSARPKSAKRTTRGTPS